jgi:hypothetical protein
MATNKIDPLKVIKAEIPIIQKILNDETWYEGERRHCTVDMQDIEIQKKVAEICINKNTEIRIEAETMIQRNSV